VRSIKERAVLLDIKEVAEQEKGIDDHQKQKETETDDGRGKGG